MLTATLKPLNYRTISILGVKVNFINLKTCLNLIEDWVNTNKQYQITTPNPEHIILAQSNYRLKKIINESALAIADGVGLIWATKIKNLQRLTGTDLMIEICKIAPKKGWRVFLLGASDQVLKGAVEQLKLGQTLVKDFSLTSLVTQDKWEKDLYRMKTENREQRTEDIEPKTEDFKIDYFCGAKDIRRETEYEKKEAIRRINEFKPHFLFVAYGAPRQEEWIFRNLPHLKVKVAMGVGGALDYLGGKVARAPKVIRGLGLEWLWRLLQEPWRIKRQMALVKFIGLVIKERLYGWS